MLAYGQCLGNTPDLQHHAHTTSRGDSIGRQAPQRHGSKRGPNQSKQNANESRLARPIRAEQRDHFAAADVKVDGIERARLREATRDASQAGCERCLHGGIIARRKTTRQSLVSRRGDDRRRGLTYSYTGI